MKDNFDIKNNIDFLTGTNVDTDKYEKQERILDSDKHNNTFEAIEKSLNLLYEKTRSLQDIIDYSNSFIRNEIDTSISECKTILNNIESNRDLLKNSSYINYNVKLQSNFDTYSDRDNSPIRGVHMHNDVITLSTDSVEKMELDNILVESRNKNYNILNTKDDIAINETYRTFFMFDRIQKDPIREKIIINLPSAKTINKINLIPSNCNIVSIEYIDENNNVYVEEGYNSNLIRNRVAKSVIINIESSNYIISQVDYNEVKDEDFWDIVNQIKNDEVLIVDKKRFYYYLFGLDKISIELVSKEKKSAFFSKDVKIDKLKDNEYITIEADYVCEKGSVEFSIIDGTTEIPIIPESQNTVLYEKIFYKIPTRFTVGDINSIKVYEDGVPVKTSLNEAVNSTNEKFTVSYIPKEAGSISSLLNDSIKVKAVIRSYDDNYIPYIKSIKVKKYGGGGLWIDNMKI